MTNQEKQTLILEVLQAYENDVSTLLMDDSLYIGERLDLETTLKKIRLAIEFMKEGKV